jgi:hypothetical protein
MRRARARMICNPELRKDWVGFGMVMLNKPRDGIVKLTRHSPQQLLPTPLYEVNNEFIKNLFQPLIVRVSYPEKAPAPPGCLVILQEVSLNLMAQIFFSVRVKPWDDLEMLGACGAGRK